MSGLFINLFPAHIDAAVVEKAVDLHFHGVKLENHGVSDENNDDR